MPKKFRANDTWKRDGGRIVVTGNPGIGRYIFGVPWLLFGLHFYYSYLVMGIAEYIKAGDVVGIFTGVFGWLIIVLFGAILGLIAAWPGDRRQKHQPGKGDGAICHCTLEGFPVLIATAF